MLSLGVKLREVNVYNLNGQLVSKTRTKYYCCNCEINGSAFSVSFFPSTSSSPQRRVFSEMAKAVCSVSSQVRDDHDYDDFTDDDDDDDVDVDGGGDGDDEGALISDEEADTESGFLSQHWASPVVSGKKNVYARLKNVIQMEIFSWEKTKLSSASDFGCSAKKNYASKTRGEDETIWALLLPFWDSPYASSVPLSALLFLNVAQFFIIAVILYSCLILFWAGKSSPLFLSKKWKLEARLEFFEKLRTSFSSLNPSRDVEGTTLICRLSYFCHLFVV